VVQRAIARPAVRTEAVLDDGSATSTTTHGSPHPYDTQVPILMYGPRWIAPGRVDASVHVVDIAPTLAQWLGVTAPPTSEGKPLPVRSPATSP
jgi:arylsulfatase A-like enzyme